MNREDTIRMAQEAGAELAELPRGDAWLFAEDEHLERFAELVASAEREACAMECEQQLSTHGWAQACIAASAIRARSKHD